MEDKSIQLQKAYMLFELINIYYEFYGAGGSLHIVLDDGNYEDHHIKVCIEEAKKNNDYWGEVIGTMMLGLSEGEKEQICERGYEIYQQFR